MPHISYLPDNLIIEVDAETTILQASLQNGIPHTHVCGGNARCSTCRVVVLEGAELCLAPRNEREQLLAERLHFAPMIRLACQTQVQGDIKVRRLVLDEADIKLIAQPREGQGYGAVGEEKHAAILFADIRGFTTFAEKQLPYDVIHVLNRYFYAMRQVIEAHGGYIDNYMGDGLLALFGVHDAGANAAEQAVRAGLGMLQAMDDLQPYLQRTYGQQLQIGVGIHCGEIVIGNIGDAQSDATMVIGDAVNFASRIESANKEVGSRLLISEQTYGELGGRFAVGQTCELTVKGKSGTYMVYEIVG